MALPTAQISAMPSDYALSAPPGTIRHAATRQVPSACQKLKQQQRLQSRTRTDATRAPGSPLSLGLRREASSLSSSPLPLPLGSSRPSFILPRASATSSSSSSSSPLSPSSSTSSSPSPVSSSFGGDSALVEFICQGPLIPKVGLTQAEVEQSLDQWLELGSALAQQLQFDPAQGLGEGERSRIFQYYLPVYFWVRKQMDKHGKTKGNGAASTGTPIVIGVSAPQGCGKTTVVESLEYLFEEQGIKAASVSLDDFYLTGQDQMNLAKSNPENKLLELRGNAGSHDMDLAEKTMDALLKATGPEVSVPLPRYDKSANSGRGDRAPLSSWPTAQGPVDVVLLEGWMLGFHPAENEEEVIAVDPQLAAVNKNLTRYSKLHNYVDAWIIIQVEDVNCVFQWRLEAEIKMRSSGKAGMTDEQVADFVSRYIPAYKAYLPEFYSTGTETSQANAKLMFYVDKNRNPLA